MHRTCRPSPTASLASCSSRQGDAAGALDRVTPSRARVARLGMPYDAARARVDIARVCRAEVDDERRRVRPQTA